MASDPQARLAPRRKLSAQVTETLRAQLLAGDILPGQQLPTESRLTKSFGVSRTVIREALAALAADGLVEARQGAGVFAANHPASTVGAFAAEMGSRVSAAINVLEVRLAIEVESASLAASRRNPSQLASIQEAFFEFERLLRLGQTTGSADFAFHRAIAAATNNPYYVEMLDALGERAIPCDVATPFSTELAFNPEYQAVLQREHLAILDAIAAGEAESARGAMRRHLAASLERYGTRLHERTASYSAAATEEA